MRGGFVLRSEYPGAFQRDVHAQIFPRQLRGVLDGGDLDNAVTAADRVAFDRHWRGETPVNRIVAQQMRIGFHRRQVVHGDDFDVAAFRLDNGAQNIAPNPAKSIDDNTHGHFPFSYSSAASSPTAIWLSRRSIK